MHLFRGFGVLIGRSENKQKTMFPNLQTQIVYKRLVTVHAVKKEKLKCTPWLKLVPRSSGTICQICHDMSFV
jgi:hypothetical protein